MFTFTSRLGGSKFNFINISTLFAHVSGSRIMCALCFWRWKTLCKFPVEHADHIVEAYNIVCLILLSMAIHWQSLLQSLLIWSSKESLWSIVTPKSFCELSCLSSVAFNLTCNCWLFILLSMHLLVASIAFVFVLLRITLLLSDHFCDLSKSDWRPWLVAWGATQ